MRGTWSRFSPSVETINRPSRSDGIRAPGSSEVHRTVVRLPLFTRLPLWRVSLKRRFLPVVVAVSLLGSFAAASQPAFVPVGEKIKVGTLPDDLAVSADGKLEMEPYVRRHA